MLNSDADEQVYHYQQEMYSQMKKIYIHSLKVDIEPCNRSTVMFVICRSMGRWGAAILCCACVAHLDVGRKVSILTLETFKIHVDNSEKRGCKSYALR